MIADELNKMIKSELETNTTFAKVFDLFNVQDITRPVLDCIDGTEANIAVAIIPNGDKVTYGFVIASKNINDTNVDRIKELAERHGLRGNGKKQLYIFGGKNDMNHEEIIKEIQGWEF